MTTRAPGRTFDRLAPSGFRYLYAVVPLDRDRAAHAQPGGTQRVVRVGDLGAVTGPVPGSLSGGGDLRANELEWAVRHHEHVMEDVLAWAGALVPMRFGTVVISDDAAARLLERHAGALRRTLDRLAGRREWGLSFSWDVDRATALARARLGSDTNSHTGPGHQYLMMRRTERAIAQAIVAVCDEAARQIEAAIEPVATLRPAQRAPETASGLGSGPGSGCARLQVLRISALVPQEAESELEQRVKTVVHRIPGVSAAITGPWPPYSFVEMPELTST